MQPLFRGRSALAQLLGGVQGLVVNRGLRFREGAGGTLQFNLISPLHPFEQVEIEAAVEYSSLLRSYLPHI